MAELYASAVAESWLKTLVQGHRGEDSLISRSLGARSPKGPAALPLRLRRRKELTGMIPTDKLPGTGETPAPCRSVPYQAGGISGSAWPVVPRSCEFRDRMSRRAPTVQIEGFSAHADSDDIMKRLHTAPKAPPMSYITHGDPEASDALRVGTKRELGWSAQGPGVSRSSSLANPR